MSSRQRKFDALQAGRGVAALGVVLFHAGAIFASDAYWHLETFQRLFRIGSAGVEFFFVLSGFIILTSHWDDIGRPAQLKVYAVKRAVRIFPLYWLITAASGLLLIATRNPRAELIPNSILLVGRDFDAVLAVAWTLFHETLFYVMFAALFLNRAVGMTLLLAWFAACTTSLVVSAPHYTLASINLLFGIGMGCAVIARRKDAPAALGWFGAALFLATGWGGPIWQISEEWLQLSFGVASGCLVLGCVSAERRGTLKVPRMLTALGDASYSLYLIHYPLMAGLAQLWFSTDLRSMPSWFAFMMIVAAAVVAGVLVHRLIETPMLRLSKPRAAQSATVLRPN